MYSPLKYLLFSALILLSVGACSTLDILTFEADELSGRDVKQSFSVYLIGGVEQREKDILDDLIPRADAASADVRMAASACRRPPQDVAGVMGLPAAGAVLSLAVSKGFEFMQDEIASRATRLKSKARREFSGRVLMHRENPAGKWNAATCIILVRGTDNDAIRNPQPDQVGTLIVLRKFNYGDASALVPIIVLAKDSAAITAAGDDAEPARIDLTVAVALDAGVPAKEPTRSEVTTFGGISLPTFAGVPLGDDATACWPRGDHWDDKRTEPKGLPNCPPTAKLIPNPPKNATVVSVSVSLVEQGNVGLEPDKAKAEIAALQKAIGPTIDSAIAAATAR